MVKQRSQDREIERSVEIGRKNAALIPKVQNWCRNLEIRLESAGLIAEYYKLPVGTMSIRCEHASAGGVMSMHLEQVASPFIIENCRGCPHHSPINSNNIGIKIIEEYNQLQVEKEAESQEKNIAKARLHELVSGNILDALQNETITQQSILELVAGLDVDLHHKDSSNKLIHAAEIAPEFFSDIAVEIICSHFIDPTHGRECITAIRILSNQKGEIPDVGITAARHCLSERVNADSACALIGDSIAKTGRLPDETVIKQIINVQQFIPIFRGPIYEKPEFEGSRHALIEIGKRDLPVLENLLLEQLKKNNKVSRIGASEIILSLIDEFPELPLKMVEPLIRSLELDDDIYEDSADATACKALTNIYLRHPNAVQEKFDLLLRVLSTEAKEILFDVYRRISLETSGFNRNKDSKEATLADECLPIIIPILIQTIERLASPIELKVKASDVLETISKYSPEALLSQIESLLGVLAIVIHEELALEEGEPFKQQSFLEQMGFRQQYGRVINDIVRTLEKLCEVEPIGIFEKLKDIISNLSSTDDRSARYKTELIRLYAHLASHNELVPQVIPELFKGVMDFDSVSIRRAAIRAVGIILEKGGDILPQNLLEMLSIYLTDPYVAVHQNAARAMLYYHPRDYQEAVKITESLLILNAAYKQTGDDIHFRNDVLESLIAITHPYPKLLLKAALPVLIDLARSNDEYKADDILSEFKYLLPDLPDSSKVTFVQEVLLFWKRFDRDRFNSETYSSRYSLWLTLFEFDREIIQINLEQIFEAARAKLDDDPYDALKMVQLLSYHEFYSEASDLASQIAEAQNKTKRHEPIIRTARSIGAAAKGEALIAEGKIEEALQLLKEAEALEKEANAEKDNSRDFIETFTVADKISKRFE